MFQVTIPISALLPAHYELLGRLAVVHRAAITNDGANACVVFHTLRIDGADISGDERTPAEAAGLIPVASEAQGFPFWLETSSVIDNLPGFVSTDGQSHLYCLSEIPVATLRDVLTAHLLPDSSNLLNSSSFGLRFQERYEVGE
jgi:hypothetical protein